MGSFVPSVPLKKFLDQDKNLDGIIDWEVVDGKRHIGIVEEVGNSMQHQTRSSGIHFLIHFNRKIFTSEGILDAGSRIKSVQDSMV